MAKSAHQQTPATSCENALDLDVRDSRWASIAPDIYVFIKRAVETTYQAVGESGPFELSVVLTDDPTIQCLNKEFRGKDQPTNVLSFAVRDAGGVHSSGPYEVLGDVVISFDTTAHEAQDVGRAVLDHFCHLLVHGVLHVLGYDHVHDKDAVEMEALETYVLKTLGCLIPGVIVIVNIDRRDMNEDPSSRKPHESGADQAGSFLNKLRALFPGFKRKDDAVREVLEELIEDDDAESIDGHERLLLGNVLHLRDVTAYDVMVPRADITAVEVNTPLKEVADLIGRWGHSRVPVYRETLDDVVGMIHIKDVLPAVARDQSLNLRHLVRNVMCVSPATRVLDLLVDMRLKRTHMALVVDEYGGIDGLVTIEDVVEQIVGEIEDEHDRGDEPEMKRVSDGTLVADARVDLEVFEQEIGLRFSEDDREDTDTLGGLVFRLVGRVPLRGELITHGSGLEFEIMDADPRRIRRLRIRNLPEIPKTTE